MERCGRRRALASLVKSFDRLPAEIQQRLLANVHWLDQPLHQVAGLNRARRGHETQDAAHDTAQVLDIITQAGAASLAYLPAELLIRSREASHTHAAAVLLVLAATIRSSAGGGQSANARDATLISQALAMAVRRFDQHGQADVLRAVLHLLPHMDPAIASVLDNPRHAAAKALARLLRDAHVHPAQLGGLLRLLPIGPVGSAAASALRRAIVAGRWAELLDAAWLLELPIIQPPFAELVSHASLLPPVEVIATLDAAAATHAVRWIDRSGLTPADCCRHLAALADAPQAEARLAAVRALIQRVAGAADDTTAHDALASFTHDAHPAIARLALRCLIACRWPGLDSVGMRLLQSPHADVRRMIADYLAPTAFDRYWDNFPRLDPQQRISGGAALLKMDRRFHQRLHERLLSDDRPTVLRALAVVAQLDQFAALQQALLRLSRSTDAYIASAAIKALGSAGSAAVGLDTFAALENALAHRDPRVRANAVEAVEQLQAPQQAVKAAALVADPHQRPRANAIGCLMQLDRSRAAVALGRMLADTRAAHRISALWLTEQRAVLPCAAQVAEASISDPDPRVRQRAAAAVRRLMAVMHGRDAPSSQPHPRGGPAHVLAAAG